MMADSPWFAPIPVRRKNPADDVRGTTVSSNLVEIVGNDVEIVIFFDILDKELIDCQSEFIKFCLVLGRAPALWNARTGSDEFNQGSWR